MDVNEKVVEILKELSGKDSINESDRLQEELGLDSLSMVTLLLEIEDTFLVELKEEDMDPYLLITVADVINLVKKYEVHDEKEDS